MTCMKTILTFLLTVCLTLPMSADEFSKHFTDNTLRLDLGMVGRGRNKGINVEEMTKVPGWHGRRVNLDKQYVYNDLEVNMIDLATGDTIYRTSMYHGFAGRDAEGMRYPSEAVVRLPFPKQPVLIEMLRMGARRDTVLHDYLELNKARLKEIKKAPKAAKPAMTVLNKAKIKHPIKLALVSEGFTQGEMTKFEQQAAHLMETMFAQPAFGAYRDRFQVTAVELPSQDSGITKLSKGEIKNTPINSQFGAFSLERLLTIPSLYHLADVLQGVPYDYVIVIANTDTYGGSGPYYNYCIGYNGDQGEEVTIHEFAHHFAALGDEYESEGYEGKYTPDIEPFEPNITTKADFSGKWQNLIDSGEAGLIEGAGYQTKGVWRGCESCLMRTVADPNFCPVCTQAIQRCILFLTETDLFKLK